MTKDTWKHLERSSPAALQAASSIGEGLQVQDSLLRDLTPMSMGLETAGEVKTQLMAAPPAEEQEAAEPAVAAPPAEAVESEAKLEIKVAKVEQAAVEGACNAALKSVFPGLKSKTGKGKSSRSLPVVEEPSRCEECRSSTGSVEMWCDGCQAAQSLRSYLALLSEIALTNVENTKKQRRTWRAHAAFCENFFNHGAREQFWREEVREELGSRLAEAQLYLLD
jgi:hypothetical protein